MFAQLRLNPADKHPWKDGVYPVVIDMDGKLGIVMAHFITKEGAFVGAWFDGDTQSGQPVTVKYWAMEVLLTLPRGASKQAARTESDVDKRIKRLLNRALKGETPRCSYAEYDHLCSLPGLGRAFQMESANGADRRGGMVLTSLVDSETTNAAILKYLSENK